MSQTLVRQGSIKREEQNTNQCEEKHKKGYKALKEWERSGAQVSTTSLSQPSFLSFTDNVYGVSHWHWKTQNTKPLYMSTTLLDVECVQYVQTTTACWYGGLFPVTQVKNASLTVVIAVCSLQPLAQVMLVLWGRLGSFLPYKELKGRKHAILLQSSLCLHWFTMWIICSHTCFMETVSVALTCSITFSLRILSGIWQDC